MDHGHSGHRRYSPSRTEQFFRCPGSIALCATVPPRPEREWTVEGRQAAILLEQAIKHDVCDAVDAWKYTPFKQSPIEVNMCDAVQECIDYVREIMSTDPAARVWSEQRVNPPNLEEPGEAAGTCDVFVWLPTYGHLFVIDYKHGIGVAVDVEYGYIDRREMGFPFNTQLMSYTSGFVLGESHIDPETIHAITIAIVQPRAMHRLGPIRTASVGIADLYDYLIVLDDRIKRAKAPDAPLKVGEKQCQFCDAITTCPAREAQALEVAGRDFQNVKQISEVTLPSAEHLEIERLLYITQAKPVLEKWLDACADKLLDYALRGFDVPSMKLVDAKGKTVYYGDHRVIAEQIVALTGLSMDAVMPRKLLNITEMRDLIKRHVRKKGGSRAAKNLRVEQVMEAFAFLTDRPPTGKLKLVSRSSEEPEVKPTAHLSGVTVIPTQETNQ